MSLRLLPTGGVSLTNMAAFFKAGAEGVGIGSQLFDKQLIDTKNWTGLAAHFQEFMKLRLWIKTPKNQKAETNDVTLIV
jgi:2-keto-3-deoxy-6-phosphogluconate aldolase